MYYLVKMTYMKAVDNGKEMSYKRTPATYLVYEQGGVIEACLNKAMAYFQENTKEPIIRSISDCVISKYIGDSEKHNTYQCRIHFKTINDKGKVKNEAEYYIVDANDLAGAEKVVKEDLKDVVMDWELHSINHSKITEVIE